MDIFIQNQWQGMARYGTQKKNPMTSLLEINTKPGEAVLGRIGSREPYSSNVLGAPALQFKQLGSHLKFYDGGADVANLGGTASHNAYVCFKWNAGENLPDNDRKFILGWISGPDYDDNADDGAAVDHIWAIWAEKSGGDWTVWGSWAYDNTPTKAEVHCSTTTLVNGSTYWVRLSQSSAALYMAINENGGGISDSDSSLHTFSDHGLTEGALYAGGNPWTPADSLGEGAIAYIGLTTSTSITSWEAEAARTGRTSTALLHFIPTHPRWGVFSGKFASGTNKESWVYYPPSQLLLTEASTTSGDERPLKGRGLKAHPGMGSILKYSDPDMFARKTVFLFEIHATDGDADVLCSADHTFSVGVRKVAATNRIQAKWTPKNRSEAGYDVCLLYSTDQGDADGVIEGWYAAQVDPDTDSTAENLALFKYDATADTWDSIDDLTVSLPATDQRGLGVEVPDADTWLFCDAHTGTLSLYDFRIDVADAVTAWNTLHLDTALTDSILESMRVWVNCYESSEFVNEGKVSQILHPETPEEAKLVVGLTNRVDGKVCIETNPGASGRFWTGMDDLIGPFPPTVEDLYSKPNGDIEGATDAYHFREEGGALTYYSQASPEGHQRATLALMGTHRYIVGPPPLQYVGNAQGIMSYYPPQITFALSSHKTTAGALTVSTEYKIKATVYDPITGNESNPSGPYFFTTSASGIRAVLRFQMNYKWFLLGKEIRIYRYSDTTGNYHYESSGRIQSYYSGTSATVLVAYAEALLADATLILAKVVEEDNDPPPQVYSTTIWSGRAWVVPVLHPSRLLYSKPYKLGSFPGGNVVWTDEGMTGNILGCLSGFNGLIVLKENSIWIVPSGAEAYYAQPLVPDVGVVSGDAAVFAEGILWWASNAGIYSFNGESVVNFSERMDGTDRLVWARNPRACRAWYDKLNWRVVFACDGAGVAVDTRTGALSLLTEPAQCYAQALTSSYKGALWGSDGCVWKESAGNKSLSLDTGQAQTGEAFSGSTTSAFSLINWMGSYDDGEFDFTETCSFTAQVGVDVGDSYSGANQYFTANSPVGRSLFELDLAAFKAWAKTVVTGEDTGIYYLKGKPETLDTSYLDRTPVYYESQKNYLGAQCDNKVISQFEVLPEAEYTSATADLYLLIDTLNSGTAMQVPTSTSFDLESGEPEVLPVRRTGHQYKYIYKSGDGNDLPDIMELRTHFRTRRPRSKR